MSEESTRRNSVDLRMRAPHPDSAPGSLGWSRRDVLLWLQSDGERGRTGRRPRGFAVEEAQAMRSSRSQNHAANQRPPGQREHCHRSRIQESDYCSAKAWPNAITSQQRVIDRIVESLFANRSTKSKNRSCCEQLKNGPRSLTAPVDNLYSNGTYMLMASLAWSLKAWLALSVSETGRWNDRRREEKPERLRMEFCTFVTAMIRIPCQIARTGRHLIFRLLDGNNCQPTFRRLVHALPL